MLAAVTACQGVGTPVLAKPTFTALPTRTPRPTFTPTPFPSANSQATPPSTPEIAPAPENLPVIEAARWGTGTIRNATWSPDGKYLAAASTGGIYIFDPATWELLVWINSKAGYDVLLLFSPDSTHLATLSTKRELKVFEIPSGNQLNSWNIDDYDPYLEGDLLFSPDGTLLIWQTPNTGVIWRISDGSILFHGEDLITSPDGSMILQGDMLKRSADGRDLYSVPGLNASFSSDSVWLATLQRSLNRDQINIWRVFDGSLQASWEIGEEYISDLQFVADNTALLIHSEHRTVQLRRVADQQQLLMISDVDDVISPDGSMLATWIINDPNVDVYSTDNGNKLFTLRLDSSHVTDVFFSPDSTMLGTPGDTSQVWNLASGRLVSTLEEEKYAQQNNLAFSPLSAGAGQPPLLAGVSGYRLQVWNVLDGSLVKSLTQTPGQILGIAFTSDDERLAFLYGSEIVGSIPLSTASVSLSSAPYITIDHSQREPGPDHFSDPVISPQGTSLVYLDFLDVMVANVSDSSKIYKVETKLTSRISSSNSPYGFSSDGRIIFIRDTNGVIILIHAENGRVLNHMQLPGEKPSYSDRFLLSDFGKYLVHVHVNEQDQTVIRVLETAGGQLRYTLSDLQGYINSIALSPDGKYMAVSTLDQPTYLYGLENGSLLRILTEATGSGPIAISSDSQVLALAADDGIQLWRLSDGNQVAHLHIGSRISSLVFSHNGRYLASGSEEGLIQLWDLQPAPAAQPTVTPPAAPAPTQTPSLDSAAPLQLPPPGFAFSGTPFPQAADVIQSENAVQVSLAGQIGYGFPQAATWSPDGQRLAILSGSGVRLYESDPLREIGWLEIGAQVKEIAFSPDGSTLALVAGYEVMLYQAFDGRWLVTFHAADDLAGYGARVTDLLFSPDGLLLIGQTNNGMINVWDIEQGNRIQALQTCDNAIALGISTDVSAIGSLCTDNHFKLFRLSDGSLISDLEIPRGEEGQLALSADLTHLALETADGSVKVFRLQMQDQTDIQLEEVFATAPQSEKLTSISLSADGQYLALGSKSEIVQIWNTSERQMIEELDLSDIPGRYRIRSLVFSPKSNSLFIMSIHGQPILWDFTAQRPYHTLGGFHDECSRGSLAFSADGGQIIFGGQEGVIIYAAADGNLKLYDEGSTAQVMGVLDGSVIALYTFGRSDGNTYVKLSKLSGDSLQDLWETPIVSSPVYVPAVAISPDNLYVAAGSSDGTLHLLQASDGSVLHNLPVHDERVESLVFSPSGSLLASSEGSSVRLWRITAGQLIPVTSESLGNGSALVFSPDSQVLALGSHDAIRFFSTADGSLINQFPIADIGLGRITFSPDGLILASGDREGVIRLWDVTTGSNLSTLRGHSYRLVDLKFSPDGRTLVSLSEDGTLRVWGVIP